jgi:hypothetical protein
MLEILSEVLKTQSYQCKSMSKEDEWRENENFRFGERGLWNLDFARFRCLTTPLRSWLRRFLGSEGGFPSKSAIFNQMRRGLEAKMGKSRIFFILGRGGG